MKIRLFDNDNKIFEYIDLSNLKQSLYILNSYEDYFSDDYLHEDYYDGKDVDEEIYRLPTLNRFCFTKNNIDFYVGDIVLVKGTKKYGDYLTEIIINKKDNGFTLKENHTHFNNDALKAAVISKSGTIYDQYLKK